MHLFETGEMPHYYTIYLVKIKPTKKIIPTNVWGNINLYRHNKDWRHEPSLKTDRKFIVNTQNNEWITRIKCFVCQMITNNMYVNYQWKWNMPFYNKNYNAA